MKPVPNRGICILQKIEGFFSLLMCFKLWMWYKSKNNFNCYVFNLSYLLMCLIILKIKNNSEDKKNFRGLTWGKLMDLMVDLDKEDNDVTSYNLLKKIIGYY